MHWVPAATAKPRAGRGLSLRKYLYPNHPPPCPKLGLICCGYSPRHRSNPIFFSLTDLNGHLANQPHVSNRDSSARIFPLLVAIAPSLSFPFKLETGTPIRNTPTASPETAFFCAADSAERVLLSWIKRERAVLQETPL